MKLRTPTDLSYYSIISKYIIAAVQSYKRFLVRTRHLVLSVLAKKTLFLKTDAIFHKYIFLFAVEKKEVLNFLLCSLRRLYSQPLSHYYISNQTLWRGHLFHNFSSSIFFVVFALFYLLLEIGNFPTHPVISII